MERKIQPTTHISCSKNKHSEKKCIAVNTYISKEERDQVNNLTLYLKTLEKEEKTKPKDLRKE